MAVDEQDELPEATQREAELQRKIDGLQNQSAEKLSQPESENLNLRDENQALNTESNKKRRFRAQIRPMPTLETPNSGTDANLPPTASGRDASTREKAKGAQTYDVEESEPELESDKEAPDGARKAESPIVAYLEHMFTKRLDAMQSMIGQQPKWSQKMKAPDSFWNPGFWCDFNQDHGHKTEDCVALKIEVNELLKKGHLKEFLSEKAKSHLSKETTGNPTEAAPVSPPRQDRVIHVISDGLLIYFLLGRFATFPFCP
ncbi:hypothetical protein DY000_02007209 [Brassica cretica]|uniref:Uncharacterized protein n=1 Tax=Brassica cretica TaxID=69181 RepID=A0ABQ7CG14_BRACR|nr:hypothetical protein DY000_02007209 [Brassica cretica]